MSSIIIPDTSLCAIVRDEIMNPAGGIIDFVNSTMPFLETGVVVDTGSIDGTREALEELALNYKNLKIFDRKFDDYASSRNFSLKKVKTKMAFVLDADEGLTEEDFKNLKEFVEANQDYAGYDFGLIRVFPNNTEKGICHNPRLFKAFKNTRYSGKIYEHLYFDSRSLTESPNGTIFTNISIKHFLQSYDVMLNKDKWYTFLSTKKDSKKLPSPRDDPLFSKWFKEWKAYNPERNEYR